MKLYYLFIPIFFIPYFLLAQGGEITEGKIVDKDGVPVKNARVILDNNKSYVSDDNGFFQISGYDRGARPKKVVAYKEGMEMSQYNALGKRLLINMQESENSIIYGKIVDKEKAPIQGVKVVFKDINPTQAAITNEKGIFSINLPSDYRPNRGSRFEIEDSEILKQSFQFAGTYNFSFMVEKKPAYLVPGRKFIVGLFNKKGNTLPYKKVILSEKTYTTYPDGTFEASVSNIRDKFSIPEYNVLKIDSIPSRNSLYVYVERIDGLVDTVSRQSPAVGDIFSEVNRAETTILIDTANPEQREELINLLLGSNNTTTLYSIKTQEEQLNQDLKEYEKTLVNSTALSDEEKEVYMEALANLQKQLEEDEKILRGDVADKKRQLARIIEDLDRERKKVVQAEEARRLEQEKFRQRIMIFGWVVLGLVLLVFVFLFLTRKFQSQRNEIDKQKQETEKLNDKLNDSLDELKSSNAKITDSIRYAQTIQQAVLPIKREIDNEFKENFVIYKPKDLVSGDFYWYYKKDEGYGEELVYLATLDCTGHGVPGAFMSMIGNTLLNDIINEHSETNAILDTLDKEVISALQQETTSNDDGMDVCLCRIKKFPDDTREVVFTGAKRPLLYLESGENKIKTLRGDSKSIGGVKKKKKVFTNTEIQLKKGDSLYLTSDGLVDQNNSAGVKYGSRRFLNYLAEIGDFPMSVQKQKIENEFQEHKNGEPQRDDITIIGVRL